MEFFRNNKNTILAIAGVLVTVCGILMTVAAVQAVLGRVALADKAAGGAFFDAGVDDFKSHGASSRRYNIIQLIIAQCRFHDKPITSKRERHNPLPCYQQRWL